MTPKKISSLQGVIWTVTVHSFSVSYRNTLFSCVSSYLKFNRCITGILGSYYDLLSSLFHIPARIRHRIFNVQCLEGEDETSKKLETKANVMFTIFIWLIRVNGYIHC